MVLSPNQAKEMMPQNGRITGLLVALKNPYAASIQPVVDTIRGKIAMSRFLDEPGRQFIEQYAPKDREWRKELLRDFFSRSQVFDAADTAQNNLRKSLNATASGRKRNDAMDNPKHEDHAHPHSRRHKEYAKNLLLNTPEVSTSSLAVAGLALQSYFHDGHQLDIQALNEEEKTNYNAKAGHAIGGAIQMLLFATEYAKENNIPQEEAWQICAAAAIMMIPHDEPENVVMSLYATRDARDIPKDALLQAYKDHEIDLFTITPSMLFTLFRQLTQEKGLQTTYGFTKQFEEDFAERLAKLSQNQTSLLENLPSTLKDTVRNAAMISAFADQLDMVAPFGESLLRKLAVQVSQQRDFFNPIDVETDIYNGKGNKHGNPQDSDFRRILWEIYHLRDTIVDTPFENSKVMKNIIRDFQVSGIFALKNMGETIMDGPESTQKLLDDIMNRRLLSLGLKLLSNVSKDDYLNNLYSRRLNPRERFERGMFAKVSFENAQQTLNDAKNDVDLYLQIVGTAQSEGVNEQAKIAIRKIHDVLPRKARANFERLTKKLEDEKNRVFVALKKRKTTFPVYSEVAVKFMKRNCDIILAKILGISLEEVKALQAQQIPSTEVLVLPFDSYDSTTDPEDSPTRRDLAA